MKQELADKVVAAFADVPYPGDDNISMRYLEDFVGQTEWEKVPLAMLKYNSSDMPLFTATAFHFYLPAFLYALLTDPESDGYFGDYVIFNLAPDRYLPSLGETAIGLFSREQKAVVLEFLRRHTELFPHSGFSWIDDNWAILHRAIKFWSEN